MAAAAGARGLVRESLRIRLDQVDVLGSLRGTTGVLIPLVIGLATGGVADGVFAAIGALCAGFASFQGAYRRRVGITVLVGVGMAAATLTGAIAQRADWSAIIVVAAWAFIAGMLTCLSQAALVVGLQWAVAVIIVNAVPMTTAQALVRAGMILAGALVQTVLTVFAWPVRTYRIERDAVAALYLDLASYADAIARGEQIGVPPTALDDAAHVLSDPHPLGRPDMIYTFQALVDEAGRLRLRLSALAALRRAAERAGADVEEVDALLGDCAGIMRAVAGAFRADSVGALAHLAVPERITTVERGRDAWWEAEATRLEAALAGELRSVLRLATAALGRRPTAENARPTIGPDRSYAREALVGVRSNLSWNSTVFRHALRLAVTLSAAMVIYRLSGLAHGYWIALTALLVLRPDYSSTTTRGLSRIVGTALGVIVATVIVAGFHPDATGITILFALSTLLAFLAVQANYALFSICVTAYVVFLLAFAHEPAISTALDRLESTLIGGGLALGVYLLWPTWESTQLPTRLAELLTAQASYADGVLTCVARPRADVRRRLDGLRSGVRRARSNAETSLGRMVSEPERSRRSPTIDLNRARRIIAASRRATLSLLALHAELPPTTSPPLPAVSDFRAVVVGQIRENAAALRRLEPAVAVPLHARRLLGRRTEAPPRGGLPHRLRSAHRELSRRLSEASRGESLVALVLAETDELVDAVDSTTEAVLAQPE